MASEQHIVEQVFGAALNQSPEERRAFLDEACHNAPELRRQVEELLLANQRLGSFLEQPALGPVRINWPPLSSDVSARHGEINHEDSSVCCLQPEQLIIDRFRIIRFLARGGMGEIYEVEDLFLQNVRVALKLILPHIASSAGSARRFEQEVLLARKVIHPNLCPIYDIARSSTSVPPFLFLTMKLLSGETLASRLRRSSPISPREAFSMLQQLCAGLAALHVAGIIHRDIKPTNVMLEHSATALHLYIMDFGLARSYHSAASRDASGMLAGTPGYLAPELLRGDQPSQESDVFALGVLLHMVQLHTSSNDAVSGSSATLSRGEQELWRLALAEFRSEEPERRKVAFARVKEALSTDRALSAQASLIRPQDRVRLSRRQFAVGSAVAACASLTTALWNRDQLRDMLHPLPAKRFVALVKWPTSTDVRLQRMLSDVTDVIGRELARAELFDHDLLVLADTAAIHLENSSQVSAIRDSSGANLILAASGRLQMNRLYLTLQVLDSSLIRPLRERLLHANVDDQTLLPAKAVEASAELLGISRYTRNEQLLRVGTDNPEAYSAFQAAEALRRQDSAASLNEAITLYQRALRLDPRYAVAMAKLSWAYLRTYALHGDPAALNLARDTCTVALLRDPSLIDAHLVLAWVYEQTGDQPDASRELATALSLDPSNPNTLRFQAKHFADTGHFSEAEDRLKQLIAARPNFWLGHNELGLLLSDEGRYSEALDEFHAAQVSAPKNIVPLYNIGSVLLQQGRLRQAKEALQQSFSLEPNDIAAANLAAVARAQNKPQDALRFAQTAVHLNPEEPADLLELGDSSLAAGYQSASALAYKQAAEKQENQLQTQHSNGAGWMLLALCRTKMGSLPAGSAALERADALHASDMESQLFKIRTLELLGRRADAIGLIEKCLKRGATTFQMQSLPDLGPVRATPQFRTLIEASTSKTQPIR